MPFFSSYEFTIAWRYLRARRAEGGISVMTWISLVGIALGVMALVVTLAVRTGFRAEFVNSMLGSSAHVTVYKPYYTTPEGQTTKAILDYEALADRIAAVPGVTRAAPLIRGQGMVTFSDRSNVAEVYGISAEDLQGLPRIAQSEEAMGSLADFERGIAIGAGIAKDLGLLPGDKVKLIQPNGNRTAFGTTPRVNAYEVVYIFTSGQYLIDQSRIYMPMAEAQSFFNREGTADEIEIFAENPEGVTDLARPIAEAAGQDVNLWTWQDASGAYLEALTIEDNVMFVILTLIVLVAALNITSGLVMLVKNKGRDIGILRTMGLSQGSILRVFFLCGAFTGTVGTLLGVVLGCLLALNIENIIAGVNSLTGSQVWDPSIRNIYRLPAELRLYDIARAAGLSLFLSFLVTIFPARRAARMNPVEALRYE